eukprot:352630-Chlamydomonas_euryale.AAC.2
MPVGMHTVGQERQLLVALLLVCGVLDLLDLRLPFWWALPTAPCRQTKQITEHALWGNHWVLALEALCQVICILLLQHLEVFGSGLVDLHLRPPFVATVPTLTLKVEQR